ncbi:Gfo/Idh/MocA family protein [Marmoricola sp. Leaf446]|uniref:Gfo/Idh/MocA family protein n=1 Tax=Marmoricola sp. Leaf446 TaxID=1736379 RepID=UPI0009EAE94F|nr:Gfo/Idh/MocA family oxidoreductase [Marmoricola sp. Leaf446]
MTVRVAMLGAGGVARRHVEVLSALDGVEVVAVADPVRASADALADLAGARAFSDVEEALEAGPLDAAYVCVPPFAHGDPERAVIARGLPMFVEKPVGADLAVARELAGLVAEEGLATATGYHWRCSDVLPEVRARLAVAPAYLAAGYWLDKRPPVGWWAHTDRSGGQVVEQLTHVVDLARLLLGEVTEVYAAGVRVPESQPVRDFEGDRGDVDDATVATLRFASGVVASLTATSLLDAKHRAALHLFSRGLVTEIDETGAAFVDADGRTGRTPTEDPKLVVDREFVEVVRGEREAASAPYADALRSHAVAWSVAESARTGAPVRLDDVLAPAGVTR